MIAYPRSDSPAGGAAPVIRFIGLGNAGVHLADRLAMSGHAEIEVVAMNTDTQSLASSVAPRKVALGPKASRGLGTGGDPEVGYEAAQESLDEIRNAVDGAGIVFLCAGLGGGTASGIAPLLAEMAREAGATVFAVVTSPFTFEGRRRGAQASEALELLAGHTHALVHFENDRMSELPAPRSGIEETFAAADGTLLSCVTTMVEILRGGSPMPIGLSDLLAVLGGGAPASLFGRGGSAGDNRAHEALERALKSPLLDRGRLLADCHSVIAHIAGPPSLSFSEVAAVMRELNRHASDEAKLFFGVTTSSDSAAPFSVTLFGNYAGDPDKRTAVPQQSAVPVPQSPRASAPAAEPPAAEEPPPRPQPAPVPAVEEDPKQLFPEPAAPAERPQAAARAPREPAKPAKPAAQPKVKQETLPFESVARGRFEKSEPTIVEGEDLDVPTFLRMRGKTQ